MKLSAGVGAIVGVALFVEPGLADTGSRANVAESVKAHPLQTDLAHLLVGRARVSVLRIENVRIEAPPADAPKPSSVLRFDVLNEGALRVTDVQIEIAIVEKERSSTSRRPPIPVAGPFRINGHATIEAGYTVNYEMLLRNLSSQCPCVANVSIVSARPLSPQ